LVPVAYVEASLFMVAMGEKSVLATTSPPKIEGSFSPNPPSTVPIRSIPIRFYRRYRGWPQIPNFDMETANLR
jgi:hypothetical protein